MGRYSLIDFENISGIKADTIRMWERRYNILSPNRTSTNRRWYDDDDLVKIINISVLSRNGIKISRIAAMADNDIRQKVMALSEDNSGPAEIISQLIIAMNSFDETAVNDVILRSLITMGFEETFTGVLFPFLHKVGFLWHTGSVNPGTEHFISCTFRRKLIAATDALPASNLADAKRCLLFLPEGEYHELGLLFYTYLVLKRGYKVLYLGQSTPFDSVVKAASDWHPDLIITGIQSDLNIDQPAVYLKQLSAATGGVRILASGLFSGIAKNLKFPNIFPLESVKDLNLL